MSKGIRFVSTRSSGESVSLRDALFQGMASDGGLFIPTSVPAIRPDELSGRTFADMAFRVLRPWIGDAIPESILEAIIQDAFNFAVPVVEDAGGPCIDILELFHGPTLSFKDFGARMLGRLLGYFLADSDDSVTILVATSGDTGSAVADGCAGIPGLNVVLLFPDGQISPVQEQQLVLKREGVCPVRVQGSFDDCQRLVKSAFGHDRLGHRLLSTANSINVGRLLPQMMYYIHAGMNSPSEDISFCIPSGNLGNLTAGILATQSGLSVSGFLAAHNRNDFFVRYLQDEQARFSPSVRTVSNAMDVGAPSNFERLQVLLGPDGIRKRIKGETVTDGETIDRIRETFESNGNVVDPHTAVGLEAVSRLPRNIGEKGRWIVLSTAHPAKFPETIRKAIGQTPDVPPELAELTGKIDSAVEIEARVEDLVDLILQTRAC